MRLLSRSLLNLALPDICPLCLVRPPAEGSDTCGPCTTRVHPLPASRCPRCGGCLEGILDACGECVRAGGRPWTDAVSVFPFSGTARELVHRFKYQGHTYLAEWFAERMAADWRRHGHGTPDVIVPVPLHWFRQMCRGYNQAELLARGLSKRLIVRRHCSVRRRRWTDQQALLDFGSRQTNMTRAFAVRRNACLSGQHVLLVDDVMTTGATLAAVTQALWTAHAARVSIITAARG